MEWTKIPTTLITKRFTDYELASIVKFQLVWAINEEQPDKKTCLRYMTSKQYETAMTYLDSVSATVSDDVSQVIKKREREKIRYSKIKDLSKNLPAECQQNVSSLPEQIREYNIREDNIPPVSNDTSPKSVARFKKPTLEEIEAYCKERNNGVDANKWYDYYTANGWKVGRNPMKDWKATVRTWERNESKPAEKEPMFLVERGKFYIDDDEKYCKGYTDLAQKISLEDREKLWEWFMDKFEGQEIKLSTIRSVLTKKIGGV